MTESYPQEIEAKFVVVQPTQAAQLRTMATLGSSFSLGEETIVEQTDIYLDTPAYQLLRHGIGLRIRHTSAGYQVTLKSLPVAEPSYLHKRIELEAALDPDHDPFAPESWPDHLRDYLTAQVGPFDKLRALCTLQQTRYKRLAYTGVRTRATEPFAELSIDEIHIFAGSPDPDDQPPPLDQLWEVEAELLPGQAESALHTFAEKLARLRGLRPSAQSKFELAVAALHAGLPSAGAVINTLQPTMHMADACRLFWRRQLGEMLRLEAGVRVDADPEFIHDLRVAIRRTRTALQLFKPFFRRKRLREFAQALHTTGRKLGAVRDYDVALARFADELATESSADKPQLVSEWETARAEAFAKLQGWLASAEYAEFLKTFAKFCATPGKGARHLFDVEEAALQPFQVRHALPLLLHARFAQVRAFEVLFETTATPSTPMLHQLRIACKLLRYTLEFAQPLLGPANKTLVNALKTLQSVLGELNDAAVSRHLLAELDLPDDAEVIHYDAQQAAKITELSAQVREHFANFVSVAKRRQFALTIARL